MSSTLIAHAGAEIVTRAELAKFSPPPSTATWKPLYHKELIEIIEDKLTAHGYQIMREQFAVQNKGLKLFATLDLQVPTNLTTSAYGDGQVGKGLGFALGLRHGNDKSMRLEMVGGSRVFCCDNLALSGDVELLKNKHTHGIYSRLRNAIGGYIGRLGHQIEMIKDRFGVWQAAEISDDQAKVVIYDAIQKGIIPSRIRPEIHNAYFNASALGFEDCEPRSAWGLHNSFTRGIKALSPAVSHEANISLTPLFNRLAASSN